MKPVFEFQFTVVLIFLLSFWSSWELNAPLQAPTEVSFSLGVRENSSLSSSVSQTVIIPCDSGRCGVNSTANISNAYYQPKGSLPAFIHFCVTGEGGNAYYVNTSIPNAIFPVNGLFTFIHARNVPLAVCNRTNLTSIGGGYQDVCVPRQNCKFYDARIVECCTNGTYATDSVIAYINGTQEYVTTLEADLPSAYIPLSPITGLVCLIFIIPLFRIWRRR